MFGALADTIDTLVVPAKSDALTALAQQHGRMSARLCEALGDFDAAGAWELDGSATMTAWTRVHLGWTNQTANRWLRTARRLRDLPVTQQAWADGRLTDGQIEVIVTNLTDRRAPLFAQHEADVIPTFEPLDVLDTVTAMRDWATKADAVLDAPEPPEEPPASASMVQTLDGRGYLKGSFDAEGSEVIATGLRLADSSDRDLTNAERQGQAMVDVFRFYLDHQADKLAKRHRPHLNVVITHPNLHDEGPGRTLDGNPLPGLVVRKIACDANIHRVITDGQSSILDYGRATRSIPPAVYTSLVLRDMGCRFPGCDRRAEWCEGHHIWHWDDGGPTDLSNLVLLCSRHHHHIHMPGWHIKLRPDGALEVTQPDGTTRTSDPPLLC
ncbi:MAG: DUF222 domain-containing protein [Acidimicrobiales bacterium]